MPAPAQRITHFVWTDMAAAEEPGFNAWYDHEHMPDRILRIPGFLRGRRFRALSGGPRYLAYYEMATRDVFWSDKYVKMRGEPDAKSRHYVTKFANALRSTGGIAFEADSGEGEFLAIAGITRPEDETDGVGAWNIPDLRGVSRGSVSRIRVSMSDPDLVLTNFKRMEALSRGALRLPDRVPAWMLTVEGRHAASVTATLDRLIPAFGNEARVDARATMTRIFEISAPAAAGPVAQG
jgi:hypothetical protein